MKSKHLSLLFSVVILGWLLYSGDPEKISETLSDINLLYIPLVLVLYLGNVLTKNLRWCVVLGDISLFRKALPLCFMGLAANSVTPGRVGGEPFRAYLLNRNTGCPFGKGIASVFTEKVMDIIILTCFSIVGMAFIVRELGQDDTMEIFLQLGAMVGILVFLLYTISHPTLMERIARRLISVSKRFSSHRYIDFFERKLISIIASFKESLKELLEQKKNAFAAFFLTTVIWVNEATRLYLILLAMDIEVHLGAVIVASSVAAIVGGIVPGGAGNAALISTILAGSGVLESDATSAGLVMVITSIWIAIPIGAFSSFITKIDIPLSEMVGQDEKAASGEAAAESVTRIAGDAPKSLSDNKSLEEPCPDPEAPKVEGGEEKS